MGVSFFFGDTPQSSKLLVLQTAMQFTICQDHCLSYGKCSKYHMQICPKFTEQTMYICKYLSLQSLMAPVIYPYPGTWEDQPLWYITAYSIANNQLNKIKAKK